MTRLRWLTDFDTTFRARPLWGSRQHLRRRSARELHGGCAAGCELGPDRVCEFVHRYGAGDSRNERRGREASDHSVEFAGRALLLLQAFIGTITITALFLAAVASDRAHAISALTAKEAELGDPEVMRAVERSVMLRTIDTHWIEHLTAMEELREGIYLRGYGQQDPLVAYKREAHDYFQQMQSRVAAGVAQTVLRVSVRTAEQAEQTEQQQGSPPQQTSTSGNGTTSTGRADLRTNRDDTPPTTSTGKVKLGRNDPCWCGSGKKFKKCHGR